VDDDPRFVRDPDAGPDGLWNTGDEDYGDLRLRRESPAIDAGNNSAIPSDLTTDVAGNARFVDIPGTLDPGAIVDMGAYEAFLFPGDASGDYMVSIDDLLILAGNWKGTGNTFTQGDFSGDGMVNEIDLGILAGNWQKSADGTGSPAAAPMPGLSAILPPQQQPSQPPPRRTPIRATARVISLLEMPVQSL